MVRYMPLTTLRVSLFLLFYFIFFIFLKSTIAEQRISSSSAAPFVATFLSLHHWFFALCASCCASFCASFCLCIMESHPPQVCRSCGIEQTADQFLHLRVPTRSVVNCLDCRRKINIEVFVILILAKVMISLLIDSDQSSGSSSQSKDPACPTDCWQ